jgi:tetratricopeptide (TPR) repeat protein
MNQTSKQHSVPHVVVLGGFRLVIGGTALPMRTRKTAAVLAYLIDRRGKPTHARELASVFWPGKNEREAKHNLSQAVYSIRQTLGRGAVTGTDRLILQRSNLTSDLWDLDHALDESNVVRALQMYEPFLLGIDVDSASYDAWRNRVDHALRSRVLVAAKSIAKGLSESIATGDALDALSIAFNKWPEDAEIREGYSRALFHSGNLEMAQEVFCSSQATGNVDAVAWGRFVATATHISKSAQTAESRTERFIGRDEYIGGLRHAYSRTLAKEPQVFCIQGKAGIGKTALCQQFIDYVQGAGGHVIESIAYETEQHIPYNLLAEILSVASKIANWSALPRQLAIAISELVPDIDIPVEARQAPLGPEAAQRRLFEAATRLIWSVSENGPAVVVIDDAQWADETSITWASYFLRRTTQKPIMLVVAVRSHVGDRYVSTLERSTSAFHSVELKELDQTEIANFVRAHLPRQSSPEVIRGVTKLTGGHPLLLVEVLRTVAGSGKLERDGLNLSFVERALNRVSTSAKDTAECLAIIGRPTQLTDLAGILNCEPSRVYSDCAELGDLLVVEKGEIMRFSHDIIRESVRGRLAPDRHNRLHRQIGTAFERLGEAPATLAYHFDQCSDKARALKYALQAGAASDLKRAPAEATYFYKIALANCDLAEDQISIKVRIAECLMKAGDYDQARPLLTQLIEEHSGQTRLQLKFRSMRLMNDQVMKENSRSYELLEEAREVESLAHQQQDTVALFQALRVQLILELRMLTHANRRTIDKLLAISETNPFTVLGADALRLASGALSYFHITDSAQNMRTALSWADQIGDPELLIRTLRAYGIVCYNVGKFEESLSAFERARKIVLESGAVLYSSYVMSAYACVLMEFGEEEKAVEMLDKVISAEALADESDYSTAICNRAVIAYSQGDYLRCTALAASTIDDLRGTWLEIGLRGVWGLSLIELGKIKDAQEHARLVEELLPQVQASGEISFGYVLLARLGALLGTEQKIIPLLRQAISRQGEHDPISTSRIKLALAECLIKSDAIEASHLLGDVYAYAVEKKLNAVKEHCERVRRRLRRQR